MTLNNTPNYTQKELAKMRDQREQTLADYYAKKSDLFHNVKNKT